MKTIKDSQVLHRKLGILLSDELTTALKCRVECKDFTIKNIEFKKLSSSNESTQALYEFEYNETPLLIQLSSDVLQSLTGALIGREKEVQRSSGPLTLTEQFIGEKIVTMITSELSKEYTGLTLKKEANSLNEIYSYYPDSKIQSVTFSIKVDSKVVGAFIINYSSSDLNFILSVKSKPTIKPKLKTKAESKPKVESKPKIKPEPVSKPTLKTELPTKSKPEPESKLTSKPSSDLNSKSDSGDVKLK
jgi:hypothetical protein